VPFLRDGTIVDADEVFERPPFWIRLLSRIKLIYFLALACFLIAVTAGVIVVRTIRVVNTPHVVLYKGTQQFKGNLYWSAEQETIESGKPDKDYMVIASGMLPGFGDVRMMFFTNTPRDATADAVHRRDLCQKAEPDFCKFSHLLTLDIRLDAEFRQGIESTDGVELKRTPRSTGVRLLLNHNIGPTDKDMYSMRARRQYTLAYGLSDTELDEFKNISYFQEMPIIEFKLTFSDEIMGSAVFEKGISGERAIDKAIKAWGPRDSATDPH
jgi:hypothetical protein